MIGINSLNVVELKLFIIGQLICHLFPPTKAANVSSTTETPKKSDTKERDFFNYCDHGSIDFLQGLKLNSWKCNCHDSWEGKHCHLPICQNGGNRTEENTCNCIEDWIGVHCDEKPCDEYRRYSKSRDMCVCKKPRHQGERCHLPQCDKSHSILKLNSEGNGYCKCESKLWYGTFCDKNLCGKHGIPYFAQPENGTSESETVVRCKCDDGFKQIGSKPKCRKDCHGHGTQLSTVLPICLCDTGWSMADDCSKCSYGYSGEECTYKPPSYSNNPPNNDSPEEHSYKPKKSAIWLVYLFVAAFLTCLCACTGVRLKSVRAKEDFRQAPFQAPFRSASPCDPRTRSNNMRIPGNVLNSSASPSATFFEYHEGSTYPGPSASLLMDHQDPNLEKFPPSYDELILRKESDHGEGLPKYEQAMKLNMV